MASILIALLAGIASAREVVFPARAFAEKDVVSAAAFGADGSDACSGPQDRACDDGEEIQAAIAAAIGPNSNRFLYLPKGVYHIDNTLEWKDASGHFAKGLTLIGQSRDSTVIRLRPASPGFADPAKPKAMIKTADATREGTGVSGFFNYIENLTLEAGPGNPGAIGIDFLGNNHGGVRDVVIRSPGGAGKAGLALIRDFPGPLLFKGLRIEGFDHGIWSQVANTPAVAIGNTFEDITLESQNVSGIRNQRGFMFIRKLRSRNRVPAVDNGRDAYGFITLLDGYLGGGDAARAAILNGGHMLIRNTGAGGYGRILENACDADPRDFRPELDREGRREAYLREHATFPAIAAPGMDISLGLSVEETPGPGDPDTAGWMRAPPPTGGNRDDTLINAAIDSAGRMGKTTLWFPARDYVISRRIRLRGSLRRILGTGTRIHFPPASFRDSVAVEFSGPASDLRIENLHLGWFHEPAHATVTVLRHASPRTLTLVKVSFLAARTAYRAAPGAGNLFLEDIGQITGWYFSRGQRVWARQLDLEGDTTGAVNDGADLWILGLKTEISKVVVETRNGGRTEILGGMLRATAQGGGRGNPGATPAFINLESHLALSLVDSPADHDPAADERRYGILVRERRKGVTRDLFPVPALDRKPSGHPVGSFLPLLISTDR